MDDQKLQKTVWLGFRRRRGYYNRHENLPFVQGGGSLSTDVENNKVPCLISE
jgi:hypothetical protein